MVRGSDGSDTSQGSDITSMIFPVSNVRGNISKRWKGAQLNVDEKVGETWRDIDY